MLARLWKAIEPCVKAVVAGAAGAVTGLVTTGLAQGFNWKIVLGALAGGALTGLTTFLAPKNKAAA